MRLELNSLAFLFDDLMRIRINAKAAVQKNRTGIEEYAYQVIKHLTLLPEAKAHQFFLLVPKNRHEKFDFPLPENFIIFRLKRFPNTKFSCLKSHKKY
jgi:hypothetical protein